MIQPRVAAPARLLEKRFNHVVVVDAHVVPTLEGAEEWLGSPRSSD